MAAADPHVPLVKRSPDLPPQISLSNVETGLNMHQYNGLFESTIPEKQNGASLDDSMGK
jgi:hypothetical protein